MNYNVYDAYLGSKTIKKNKEAVIIELRTMVIFGQKECDWEEAFRGL